MALNKLQKAQQALSDKFGIVTFTRTGAISTVPTSGKINRRINVGLGKFKSQKTFSVAINKKISALKLVKKGQVRKPQSVFSTKEIPSPSKKTPSVPKILSKSTLQAQQALSDLYGIPTFTLKGGISTVPISGVFKDIDVGMGKFKTEESFIDAVVGKFTAPTVPTPSAPSVGDTINNFFTELFSPLPEDTTTGITTEETGLADQTPELDTGFIFGAGGASGDIQATSENDDESFIDSIINDPIKLGIGIIAITALVFGTGGKKKRR